MRTIMTMPIVVNLVLLLLLVGIATLLYSQFKVTPNRYYIWGGFTLLLLSLHERRKDINFCRLILPDPRGLFIVEYLLLFSPLIVLSVVVQAYLLAALYVPGAVLVALIPRRKRTNVTIQIPHVLSGGELELISFLRRRFLLVSVVVTASVVFSFVPFLSLIILLLLVLIMGSAYTENEPLDMLLLPEVSASKYLWMKVRAGWILFLKLSLPTLLLYALFNFDTAYFIVVPLVAGFVGTMLSVFVKYSLYEPREEIIVPLTVSIGMVGILIPLLIPIPLLMAWRYYYSAVDNLKTYLYVYDK
jgi:hypothetical protein